MLDGDYLRGQVHIVEDGSQRVRHQRVPDNLPFLRDKAHLDEVAHALHQGGERGCGTAMLLGRDGFAAIVSGEAVDELQRGAEHQAIVGIRMGAPYVDIAGIGLGARAKAGLLADASEVPSAAVHLPLSHLRPKGVAELQGGAHILVGVS